MARPATARKLDIAEIAKKYDRVALVFQGGGALGAYQAGVYQALAAAGCEPTWLSGVSIGAINASIIAGNRPEDRIPRLRAFWETVSGQSIWPMKPQGDIFHDMRNRISSAITVAYGRPGFFRPRPVNPWLLPAGAEGATSFYDTADLRATLEKLIDFDILNDGTKRLSVGAVNVQTGNFVYFDTDEIELGPEHIMASGALPPALPPVKIEGEFYWDGGIVSNTPLQYLLDQDEDRSSLVFQVDLFSALGNLPRSMGQVLGRHKDIMYSSRTRQNTDNFSRIHGLKQHLLDALKRLPDDKITDEERAMIADFSEPGLVNIVHLIYQHKNYEGQGADYEFSNLSMNEHWETGLEDTARTLRHGDWLLPPTHARGVSIHDLHRDDPT
ncbi:patatin-like phospholipase family protein [Kaistia dalseonensis]|uniref:NTE family protein n=1 Tax=Kaistia dalseonensis TaxID=410840 RepID=A0ABU0H4Z9_9HYPH|nr:patatin-like phospholipase family protein [Kaistia dalseonensis]MCX5494809.1 patatin-like phospholipase family protein [Kaistia dalseonensis]MDQ0437390.1 NTE family protein [Kaistia dalseonensis]